MIIMAEKEEKLKIKPYMFLVLEKNMKYYSSVNGAMHLIIRIIQWTMQIHKKLLTSTENHDIIN